MYSRDIEIYHDTALTLQKDTMQCTMKGVYGSKKRIKDCIDKRIGFTQDCTECWVNYAMCSLQKCTFSCIKTAFFTRGGLFSDLKSDYSKFRSNNENGMHTANNDLHNNCLTCSENMCASSFLHCAGVNRRRAGIVTNIDRDEFEICNIREV